MKTTVEKAVSSFRILDNAKSAGLTNSERIALARILYPLRRVSDDYDAYLRDASERLRPDNFLTIAGKQRDKEPLTEEEQQTLDKYQADVTECLSDELQREIEIPAKPLTEETVSKIVADNPDMTMGVMMLLLETLTETPESSASESPESSE